MSSVRLNWERRESSRALATAPSLLSDEVNVELLMNLQYSFPLTANPYGELAARLGLPTQELLDRVRSLMRLGVLKRVGFNVNYRAMRKVAALVAVEARGEATERLRLILLRERECTHNYLREHPLYHVWFVTKRPTVEELKTHVEEVVKKAGAGAYIILLGKRTYKLSVKFDLKRGVSWSTPEVLPAQVPTLERLGVDEQFIVELARGIPLREHPYREASARHGFREEEVVSLLRELYEKRVVRNVGATLDQEKAGIMEDGMVVLNAPEEACERIALEVPEATHVVYRTPLNGSWQHPAYFMAHATQRPLIEAVAAKASRIVGAPDYRIFYSLENLKPGAHAI